MDGVFLALIVDWSGSLSKAVTQQSVAETTYC